MDSGTAFAAFALTVLLPAAAGLILLMKLTGY